MISKELLARIKKIEIRTRRMVEEVTAGAYHSVFKGEINEEASAILFCNS